MKLSVLVDNVAGSGFLAEHGLSYLIESEGVKVLLDTGNTDVFLHNAREMGINLQTEAETLVLSHGHWDHGNGLRFIKGKKLVTHPASFMERYREKDHSSIGLCMSEEQVKEQFELVCSDSPYHLSPKIVFLGSIPRITDFESKTTPFVDAHNLPDFVPDDSALAIVENNTLIVVTGCSHAGICNILLHAMEVTGIKDIRAVIGGLHLKHDNLQTRETIRFFKEQKVQAVYPAHCTALEAKVAFAREMDIEEVKTGMEIHL